MKPDHHLDFVPSRKRVRVVANDRTVADSVATILVLEAGHSPVYYFPRADVRADLLQASNRRSRCPHKGEASYWSLDVDGRRVEDAVWSYEQPIEGARQISGHLAFYWNKVDRWFEEDEEIFGHPRDPYHRVDVRPSAREVRAVFAGETIARSRRALFLFETGMPTRYYIPREDVRMDRLAPSATRSVCPYKGDASYWSIELGGRSVADAAWSYRDPLPECPRIAGHICFYPDKLDALEVEGESG